MNILKVENGHLIIGHKDTYFSKVKLKPGKHLIEVEIVFAGAEGENFVAVDNPKVRFIITR